MHTMGGDRWTWSLSSSRPVEFCVWALVQDGLHVRPFDIHSSGHGRLRKAGMDAAGWMVWFEAVVNRDVEDQERLRLGLDLRGVEARPSGLPPALFYEFDPPTIAEQLEMKEALRARTPPALWKGSVQVGELLDGLWEDYSSQPVLRRNRFPDPPRDGEQPGSPEQHHELYGSMRELGPGLPSLHCYPVAYPALIVREVAPMALVVASPRRWTWERYRDALLTGVASLARQARP
jgi:hypothetical protein